MVESDETLIPKITETVSNKEKFTRYLEKEGVLEYMTRQLMTLYEEDEKPESALEYLKTSFGGNKEEVAKLKEENRKLHEENGRLKEKVKALETRKASNGNLAPLESVNARLDRDASTQDNRMDVDNDKSSPLRISKDVISDNIQDQDKVDIKRNMSDIEDLGTGLSSTESAGLGKDKKSSKADAGNVEIVDLDL